MGLGGGGGVTPPLPDPRPHTRREHPRAPRWRWLRPVALGSMGPEGARRTRPMRLCPREGGGGGHSSGGPKEEHVASVSGAACAYPRGPAWAGGGAATGTAVPCAGGHRPRPPEPPAHRPAVAPPPCPSVGHTPSVGKETAETDVGADRICWWVVWGRRGKGKGSC